MASGIIVLSHGSRTSEPQVMLEQILIWLRERLPGKLIKGAFLEFNQPDLRKALQEMAEREISSIVVLPLFLSWGQHTQKHIPAILEEAQLLYPQLEIRLAAPLGADPRLADILRERFQEVSSRNS